MRISFLCSDEQHPVNNHLMTWIASHKDTHQVELVRQKNQLTGGDILFLISCAEIISAADRKCYKATLVLHASDLPRGRGWSPHIWELIEGKSEITLCLIEAEDKVDSGRIWKQLKFVVPKHALWDEINMCLFEKEIELIEFALREFKQVRPTLQDSSIKSTYYPRRSPADSQIDPLQSICSQFDEIRVCDPIRCPAFFELHGKKYKLTLEKIDD